MLALRFLINRLLRSTFASPACFLCLFNLLISIGADRRPHRKKISPRTFLAGRLKNFLYNRQRTPFSSSRWKPNSFRGCRTDFFNEENHWFPVQIQLDFGRIPSLTFCKLYSPHFWLSIDMLRCKKPQFLGTTGRLRCLFGEAISVLYFLWHIYPGIPS